MARIARGPWWWEQKQQYAVRIRGKRYFLGTDKEKAVKRFHELMAKGEAPPKPREQESKVTLAAVIDLFLEWTLKHREAGTYEWYRKYLQSFLDRVARLTVHDLKPHHVEDWMESHRWGPSTQRSAITAVSRAVAWGVKKGHIDVNPIRGRLEKPRTESRGVVLSTADFEALLAHVKGAFRDLLIVAWETGARPQEMTRVEARHVEIAAGRWVFPVKESKGKRSRRVVYLSQNALELTQRLMEKHPTGPLFRTQFGNPWTRFMIWKRFADLRKKVGKSYRLYDFRHSFITNGLKNGVDPITMQNLVGHTSLAMISRVYSHVSQDTDYMRKAAQQAVKSQLLFGRQSGGV